MLFLILAIICSSSIALIFKHSERQGMNRYAVTAWNYVAAVVIALAMILADNAISFGAFSITDSVSNLLESFRGNSALTGNGAIAWGVLIGIPAGLVFFLGFIYYQLAVNESGAGLSGAFAKLGILVPMSLSLILWMELPTTLQWAGIAMAVGSIVLVNVQSLKGWTKSIRPALLLLFLFGGLAEFSNKIFQKYGDIDYRLVFLITTFAVAGMFAFTTAVRKKLPIGRRDIMTGLMVGVPNLYSSFFLIMALDQIKAAVVFPVFAAGTIVVINIVGMLFFRERLNSRERVAVLLTIVALVLINV